MADIQAEAQLKFQAAYDKGQKDYEKAQTTIRDLAKLETDTIKACGQYAVGLVDKFVSQPALDIKISSSDSPDLKDLKTKTMEFEAKRIKRTKETSNSILSISGTAASMAAAIPVYGTAAAGCILALGYIADAVFLWKNSKPPTDWSKRSQEIWDNYGRISMPFPRFQSGMSADGYVQFVLEPGMGFREPLPADMYAAGYAEGGCIAYDSWREDHPARRIGGFFGTSQPEVYAALMEYGLCYRAIQGLPPGSDPSVTYPDFQQSANFYYNQKELSEKTAKDPGERAAIRWFLGEMIGLYPCSTDPVPMWVRSHQDLANFRANPSSAGGQTFPAVPTLGNTADQTGGLAIHLPRLGGVPWDDVERGQIYADNVINQIVYTAVLKFNVPVWGAQPVLEAARDAWQYYRKTMLELLCSVSPLQWFSDKSIGDATGVTELGNLCGKPARMDSVSAKMKKKGEDIARLRINRMPNGVDAFGWVALKAFEKAKQMADTGFYLGNAKFFNSSWRTIASYNDYSKVKFDAIASQVKAHFRARKPDESVADYKAAQAVWQAEQAKKATGGSEAFIIPGQNTPVAGAFSYDAKGQKVSLRDAAAALKARFEGKVPGKSSQMSTAALAALGIGGVALLGGGGYYLHKRGVF